MVDIRSLSLPCLGIALVVLMLGLATPYPLWAQANLENPQPGSSQSGIGVVSGWVCSAGQIDIEIDGARLQAAYGTSREDTRSVCGDANNGFGLLLNWNILGTGTHTVRALADGREFGRATFTVTTLGTQFLSGGDTRQCRLPNVPLLGFDTIVHWQQSVQNFVIVGVVAHSPRSSDSVCEQ